MKFPKCVMRKASLQGKTVLLRADYNVPLADGKISDDFRIRSSIPTIQKLLEYGCKVVIISHLGRPEGVDLQFSLEPVAVRLTELLGRDVKFIDQSIGPKVHMEVKRAPQQSVILLENLRFHAGEEANDLSFAKQLAIDSGAAYLVQDGFGVVHRAHASTSAITQCLPSVAGLLLEREYVTIMNAMQSPERPLVAVLGGAKVSDKIGVIKALVGVADTIIVGGAMANTFLAHHGLFMGDSKVEADQTQVINDIYEAVYRKVGRDHADEFLVLPVDLGVGTSTESTATRQDVSVQSVPAGSRALDLGPETDRKIKAIVEQAHTVIWNGTLGFAESPVFAASSRALAETLVQHRDTITSIVGGGDTADFVIGWDAQHGDSFSHVSTGGGASLELMSGEKLPGIEALLDAR
ncbi:MAG: phosphoglycerate kinase [Candidatus Saccharimonas sp.]